MNKNILDRDGDGSVLDDLFRLGKQIARLVGGDSLPQQLGPVAKVTEKIGERERELISAGADTAERIANIIEKHN